MTDRVLITLVEGNKEYFVEDLGENVSLVPDTLPSKDAKGVITDYISIISGADSGLKSGDTIKLSIAVSGAHSEEVSSFGDQETLG